MSDYDDGIDYDAPYFDVSDDYIEDEIDIEDEDEIDERHALAEEQAELDELDEDE
jgi:hypothetical protein